MPCNLIPDGKNRYRVKKHGRMLVDAVIYLKPEFLPDFEDDRSCEQLIGAASLKGVIDPVIGLPDIHQGFGLPIGGIMAMDPQEGLISAGAVGYDINCGVRLVKTNIPSSTFLLKKSREIDKSKLRKIMIDIERKIPLGTGGERPAKDLPPLSLQQIVEQGVPALVNKGFGIESDVERCEEEGCMQGANFAFVSDRAKERGKDQIGTLGGGNHFIDLQIIEKIYDPALGKKFGLFEGNLCIMIHCGSRAFGHQIGDDYMKNLYVEAKRLDIFIPFKGLAAVPINSDPGKRYFGAMACAVNYAFANRQMIMHDVREILAAHLGQSKEALGTELVYDVAHNIAKFEKDPTGKTYLIHRKGATRALPPQHEQNPKIYLQTGHPALVPGTMATPSYVLVAGPNAQETFYSVNHGAGRAMSRKQAKRTINPKEAQDILGSILTNFRSIQEVLDEAPQVYKDIDLVVDTLVERGITKKVAKLTPIAVMIGTR